MSTGAAGVKAAASSRMYRQPSRILALIHLGQRDHRLGDVDAGHHLHRASPLETGACRFLRRCAMSSSLYAISRPFVRDPAPLVTRCRNRTVANGDSITFVVRRCVGHQCSAWPPESRTGTLLCPPLLVAIIGAERLAPPRWFHRRCRRNGTFSGNLQATNVAATSTFSSLRSTIVRRRTASPR